MSRQLASYAYCGKEAYLTQPYSNAVEGFVATKVIENLLFDVQGYVGYLPSDQSIFVVFKGTQSSKEWAMDLDTTQNSYDTWPDCNCKVHAGFNRAVNLVWESVLGEVSRLQALNPTY